MLGLGSSVLIFLLQFRLGEEKQRYFQGLLVQVSMRCVRMKASGRQVLTTGSRDLFFTGSGRFIFFHEMFFMLH